MFFCSKYHPNTFTNISFARFQPERVHELNEDQKRFSFQSRIKIENAFKVRLPLDDLTK